MKGLIGDFTWRIPSEGFKVERGIFKRPAGRFGRGGPGFESKQGPHERGLAFYDEPTYFLAPNIPDMTTQLSLIPDFLELKDIKIAISGTDYTEYQPLIEEPALFKEFAELGLPEDLENELPPAILKEYCEFANTWGALGSEGTLQITRLDENDRQLDDRLIWAEAPEIWVNEIGNMRQANIFWEAIKGEWHEEIDKIVKIQEDHVYLEFLNGSRDTISFATDNELYAFHSERLAEIKQDGPITAIQYALQDLVNEGLSGRVHQQVVWDRRDGKTKIKIFPINLIGAIWLQCASAIEGEHEFEECAECSKWFEVAPGSGRTDKKYCSNACRMRAYRKRKNSKTG